MPNAPISLPGQQTLIASWTALAAISPGARLSHSAAATAALFPSWAPLNNAILQIPRDAPTSRATGLYANAGVDAWAFWVPSTRTDLDAAGDGYQVGGFKRDTTTLVMKAQLPSGMRRHDDVVRTSIASASRAGDEPVPAVDRNRA